MRLGEWGEVVASRYLERSGWKTVARNYRAGHREIDLIVVRDDVVVFVEVKTRRRATVGEALESITPKKQRDVAVAARTWLESQGVTDRWCRFDAFAIGNDGRGRPTLLHVENAWSEHQDRAAA